MSGVQSIERAFTLLRALAVGPAGVTDLAERAELPKSTVARLLSALETEGAVEQVEAGGEYRLGHTLADLAGLAAPGNNLITAARPHLMELTKLTGETSGVAVLDDDNTVYYLDHVESEEEITVRDWIGQSVPAHLVPSGIALLSGAPDTSVDQFLSGQLAPSTDRSVIDPTAIRRRIDQVRSDGFVWFEQEFDDGLSSVAAPVFDVDGSAQAALHIHGPAYRFPVPGPSKEAEMKRIGTLVAETADLLAAQLNDVQQSE